MATFSITSTADAAGDAGIGTQVDEPDRRLGAPGLHRVGTRLARAERATILPPAPFERFAGDAFWRDALEVYRVDV